MRTLLSGKSGTLMAGWENILSPEERSSLITLIKEWDRVPAGTIPVPVNSIVITPETIAKGGQLYAANCSQCHGPEGQGRGMRIPALNVKGLLTKTNDAALEQIITLGVPDTPMPAWGDRMTKADIQAVVGFLRSWEETAPEMVSPVRGGGGGGGRGRGGNFGR